MGARRSAVQVRAPRYSVFMKGHSRVLCPFITMVTCMTVSHKAYDRESPSGAEDNVRPVVEYDPSSCQFLTPTLQVEINKLLDVLHTAAQDYGMPVKRVEVRGYSSPEEDDERLIIRQWAEATPQAALDYWDRLEAPIEEWIAAQPDPALSDRLTVEVRW